ARQLGGKWGGQCIVFIDEIDAVGMRRQSLGGAMGPMTPRPQSFHDVCFHGPNGALTASRDLILGPRAWRERIFAERSSSPAPATPFLGRVANAVIPGMFGGQGGGGQLAMNQLPMLLERSDHHRFFTQ